MKKLLTCLFFVVFITCWVFAQDPPVVQLPCTDAPKPPNTACAPNIPLPSGSFHATPLIDAQPVNGHWPDYGDPDHNIVSLYGTYGNSEINGAALTHYQQGTSLAQNNVTPLCTDGSTSTPCPDGKPKAIVFLFIGFSNCDIEICGGNSDIWDQEDPNTDQVNNPNGHLKGQPCATDCPNLRNPDFNSAWNNVRTNGGDTIDQMSFLRQVYPDGNSAHWLVGPDVVVFNGALGQGTLEKWDPTPFGYYANHNDCHYLNTLSDPAECNYLRVHHDLAYNGFSDKQVQAVFIKTSNSYPQCDLKHQHCVPLSTGNDPSPDAYVGEQHLGNIVRYLKCCILDLNGHSTGVPRYPNLQLVFVTSRIYGGYAKNPEPGNGDDTAGCLNPEPFAYEESFAVQRLLVAQIDGSTSDYAGDVRYPESAPWVDWGPYIWADGENLSSAGIRWCDGQNDLSCNIERDFRYGDLNPDYSTAYWGDHTHPTADAAKKVADQLVTFIGKTQGKQGSPFVTPWIIK